MSRSATVFAIYFGVGQLLMVIALISNKPKGAAKGLEPLATEDHIGAGLLIFIALLWPLWLLSLLTKDEDKRL